jgi:hypothetical protein
MSGFPPGIEFGVKYPVTYVPSSSSSSKIALQYKFKPVDVDESLGGGRCLNSEYWF